ncbi:unnamed protein product, partial [Urochloa humidicola]
GPTPTEPPRRLDLAREDRHHPTPPARTRSRVPPPSTPPETKPKRPPPPCSAVGSHPTTSDPVFFTKSTDDSMLADGSYKVAPTEGEGLPEGEMSAVEGSQDPNQVRRSSILT